MKHTEVLIYLSDLLLNNLGLLSKNHTPTQKQSLWHIRDTQIDVTESDQKILKNYLGNSSIL